ncbi:Uncharacterised protein [Mycobacteroides abscessus subsp. abscessus]|nr:Uncharacterised protein [Mycobacteroides abscessus subsp. abscessus]
MRITRSISGALTSWRPWAFSSTWTSCSASRGTPASHRASAITAPQRWASAAGLKITAEPAARAASADPVGIATGKFHGGVTSVTSTGWNCAPSTRSSSSASWA